MTAPNTTPIFVGTVDTQFQTFQLADSTTSKVIYTAGAAGGRLDNVSITSTDTVARVFNVIVNDGSTDHVVGTVNVPIGAGTVSGTASVSLLSTLNLSWLNASGSIFLKTALTIKLAAQIAVSSGKLIDVVSFAGEF